MHLVRVSRIGSPVASCTRRYKSLPRVPLFSHSPCSRASLDLMCRRIELDLWYAVNASPLLDLEILVRTFFEIFRQRNAY